MHSLQRVDSVLDLINLPITAAQTITRHKNRG